MADLLCGASVIVLQGLSLMFMAMEARGEVVKVNSKNTSQRCSGCGTLVKKGLSVRVYHYLEWGFTEDRDVSAASVRPALMG